MKIRRDAAAIGAATAVVGVSFGAIAVAQGLPPWAPILMSLLVYAGGAQFLAAGLLAVGSPVPAILGGLLINARHLPFGLAIGGSIADRTGGRLLGSHLLVDETTAFTLAQPDTTQRRRVFWTVGVVMFACWNLGTVAGVLVGESIGDPKTYGLDAAFPAGLLALLLPSLKDRATRLAAATGAVIAVAFTPLLPAGLPILLALAGVAAVLLDRSGTLPARSGTAAPSFLAGPDAAAAERDLV